MEKTKLTVPAIKQVLSGTHPEELYAMLSRKEIEVPCYLWGGLIKITSEFAIQHLLDFHSIPYGVIETNTLAMDEDDFETELMLNECFHHPEHITYVSSSDTPEIMSLLLQDKDYSSRKSMLKDFYQT